MAGVKMRVGYDTKKRGFLLTDRLSSPVGNIHRVDHFLGLAKAIGAEAPKKDYEFFITDPDRKKTDRLLETEGIDKNDRFVALNPGGNWEPKRWSVDRFAQLADSLVERYGVKILITGAEKDRPLADEISQKMKNKSISICGKTEMRELATVFKKADLVISGDSGPMHIAVSTGAKVIALFGPTSARITGPYGAGNYAVIRKDVGCEVPCYDFACKDYKCMKAITADDVIGVIEEKGYLRE
jgi:lipopolysaccharide heptosyltransferase II